MTTERKLILYFIASLIGVILLVGRIILLFKEYNSADNFKIFMHILSLAVWIIYTIVFVIKFIKVKNAFPADSNPDQ
jgi:uncharacterized membrane protein